MRISDWSSDVCTSDLRGFLCLCITGSISLIGNAAKRNACATGFSRLNRPHDIDKRHSPLLPGLFRISGPYGRAIRAAGAAQRPHADVRECGNGRSEEHTSELQSLMRISYAVFCLKKKT